MNYYNIWSWLYFNAFLVFWLPLAKLLGLLSWSWLAVTAPVWVPWALAAVGGLLAWAWRKVTAWHPSKEGVL